VQGARPARASHLLPDNFFFQQAVEGTVMRSTLEIGIFAPVACYLLGFLPEGSSITS
jgi:hypothetical protein